MKPINFCPLKEDGSGAARNSQEMPGFRHSRSEAIALKPSDTLTARSIEAVTLVVNFEHRGLGQCFIQPHDMAVACRCLYQKWPKHT